MLVSIVESGSTDGTASQLRRLEADLTYLGALHSISTGRDLVQPVWKPPKWYRPQPREGANRIAYLAGLRNAALWPMLELARTKPRFDKVVFVNDVLLCGGDLLRLLAHDADMACGYDFATPGFYDNWVLEYGWDDHIRSAHLGC